MIYSTNTDNFIALRSVYCLKMLLELLSLFFSLIFNELMTIILYETKTRKIKFFSFCILENDK